MEKFLVVVSTSVTKIANTQNKILLESDLDSTGKMQFRTSFGILKKILSELSHKQAIISYG